MAGAIATMLIYWTGREIGGRTVGCVAGLTMALAMTVITDSGIHGPLPRTVCLVCLTLMWMEAVLGLCLGCEIYGASVRRGWRAPHDEFEICANGACDVHVNTPAK